MLGVQGQRARGLSAAAGRFVVCIDGERLLAVEDGAICVHFAEQCLMSVELAVGAPQQCGAEQPMCPGLGGVRSEFGHVHGLIVRPLIERVLGIEHGGLIVAGVLSLAGCAGQPAKTSITDLHAEARASFIAQDYQRTLALVEPEALKGTAWAQYTLGYMYYYGRGIILDRGRAYEWIKLAAGQGYVPAKEALRRLHPPEQSQDVNGAKGASPPATPPARANAAPPPGRRGALRPLSRRRQPLRPSLRRLRAKPTPFPRRSSRQQAAPATYAPIRGLPPKVRSVSRCNSSAAATRMPCCVIPATITSPMAPPITPPVATGGVIG